MRASRQHGPGHRTETSVCARVGNMVPATMWSSWVGANPMEWSMDPGLTASAEGSPRPAAGVRSGHEGREAYQHRVVCTESRRIAAHVLESPRSEIRVRGEKFFAEGKVFTEAQARGVHGIARSLDKVSHVIWKDCHGEDVGMEERFS
jgi:hypothetical protein